MNDAVLKRITATFVHDMMRLDHVPSPSWCIVYIHIFQTHLVMVFFCFLFKSVLKSLDVLAAQQKINTNTKQKHPLCSAWIRPIMTLNEAPFLLCLVEGHLLHASVVNIGISSSFFSWNLTTSRSCCQLWKHQVELVQLHAQAFWMLPSAPVKLMGQTDDTFSYGWWKKSGEVSRLNHYLQRFFCIPGGDRRISSINSFWVSI